MWQVAAAAQYLRWGAPLTAPQRDPILGDGDGPDGPGLSRARSPADVHLGLGLGSEISDALRSPCNGRLRIGNWTGLFAGQLFLLHASNLVNSPLKIGAEGRRRIRALGNEGIGAGRCCGAHRSDHRRRCRKRSGGGRFGDTSSSLGRGRGWDCNRSFVYDSGSGCLGTGPGFDGAGRLWGFQRCWACSPGRLWSGWICSHGLRGVRFGDRGRFRDRIQTYRRIACHAWR